MFPFCFFLHQAFPKERQVNSSTVAVQPEFPTAVLVQSSFPDSCHPHSCRLFCQHSFRLAFSSARPSRSVALPVVSAPLPYTAVPFPTGFSGPIHWRSFALPSGVDRLPIGPSVVLRTHSFASRPQFSCLP